MNGKRGSKPIELSLFDLESDVGEKTNLADSNSDIVKRLQLLAEWAREDLGDGKRVGNGARR